MSQRIVVIQGHPDPSPERYCRALADAYASAAESAGHEVRRLDVAALGLPPLVSRADWQQDNLPPAVAEAQEAIEWAGHVVLVYPLWLGDVPAALKAFLEQVLRPGFAFTRKEDGSVGPSRLKGRSAHVIVTMGMPGVAYRVYFRAHSLKSLKRNILHFVGIRPVRTTLVGMVEAGDKRREEWLQRIAEAGRQGR
ncbi:NAD(P)H-dependent oxidoreductase [Alkalisalibacterium limincola]|uniref:NAD(P)H-dependent oxidoreductase n=1 Tax=Alkalisalibacterium limincola TaxID=2699169 RepID=A0A5C8KM92_9GAMM|nr:NAD(P)H-dependent oxidoreductase [Alkalisalibacterium limincola]TXK60996.1 NAD(P)H-dependent oxidoreductase [Alkalisalibacterium limincola]